MAKNCLGHLIDFLFCKSVEVDRNNIIIANFDTNNNIKVKTECSICLENKKLELCCVYCKYQSCKKCKYDWYSINMTCPICRQNNVL